MGMINFFKSKTMLFHWIGGKKDGVYNVILLYVILLVSSEKTNKTKNDL